MHAAGLRSGAQSVFSFFVLHQVDSFNSVDLFFDGVGTEVLVEARDLMFRGMWWCRMREAILNVMRGTYTPAFTEVNLQEFARDLCKGRSKVSWTAPNVTVRLESLLCNIILDNAITNAIRHGCPNGPQVAVPSHLHPLSVLPPSAPTRCHTSTELEVLRANGKGLRGQRWLQQADRQAGRRVCGQAGEQTVGQSIVGHWGAHPPPNPQPPTPNPHAGRLYSWIEGQRRVSGAAVTK